MQHYFMSYGILVNFGEDHFIHQAAIFHNSTITTDEMDLGFNLNTNRVSPMEVEHQIKEISEVVGDRKRSPIFDPESCVRNLDNLNWAGFTYIHKEHDQDQPVIMFINDDKYVDLDKWKEISTERALATINKFAEPKEEE